MAGRGVVCATYGCNNYRQQTDRKSFYRFPRNKEICKQWVICCRRADLNEIFKTGGPEQLNKTHVLCSDHFVEKDFQNKNLLSQGIWPGSVSSVLPNAKKCNVGASPKKRKREEELEPQESANIETEGDDSVSFKVRTNCEKYFPLVTKCRALQKTVSRQRGVIRTLRAQVNNLKHSAMKCNSDESRPNVSNDVVGKFIPSGKDEKQET